MATTPFIRDVPAAEALAAWRAACEAAGCPSRVDAVRLGLHDAVGRVTAEPVWATRSSPSFDAAGMDGIAVRAFENQVYYVFADSVGPQGDGLWSAGDSKIVAPDGRLLALANNRDETVIQVELDLARAGRKYAREALNQPAFLRAAWKRMLTVCQRRLRR